MCQARVSNKSVLQECFRVLRERECVLPECATRVSSKSVPQECFTRVSRKSVPQECPTRVEYATRVSRKSVHTIVREECQARVFCKSGFECDRASPVRFSLFCRNPSSTWTFKKCIRVRGFYQVYWEHEMSTDTRKQS